MCSLDMLQAVKACQFLIHKSKHLDIHENMIIESSNGEIFEYIYPYKTEHELSSGGSKRPWDESKENILNSEKSRRIICQRMLNFFG